MKQFFIFLALSLILPSCNLPAQQVDTKSTQAIQTTVAETVAAKMWTNTPEPTFTFTPFPTDTATPNFTATFTLTPTETFTPTITPTATFAFPTVVVNQQAHCRYGPHKAYLHAADLYSGDTGQVRSRFVYSNWLYIKFDKLNYFCWVAPSVVDVTGNLDTIIKLNLDQLTLVGPSVLYDPPDTVIAVRVGKKVTITWSPVKMTKDDDRGYQLELFVCQNGNYLWWPVSFPDQYTTSYTVEDEKGCPFPSSGKIATVEKHGYTKWKEFYWPQP